MATSGEHPQARARELAVQLIDTGLNDQERRELVSLASASPQSCDQITDMFLVLALLNKELGGSRATSISGALFGDELALAKPAQPIQSVRARSTHRRLHLPGMLQTAMNSPWCATAAVALLFYCTFGLLAWNLFPNHMNQVQTEMESPYPQFAEQEPATKKPSASKGDVVATLTAEDESRWRTGVGDNRLPVGLQLRKGQVLDLLSGTAELQFTDGAVVTLEGPTQFAVQSGAVGKLDRGRLLADVPKSAIGFTIHTPQMKVVDLGTEFGVFVDPRGNSEVHVFRGSVDATEQKGETNGKPIRLFAGDALRTASDLPEATRMAAARTEFKRPRQLTTGQTTLLAFFPFDGAVADEGPARIAPLEIENITFVPGFEGKAANFDGHSRIELPIDVSPEVVPELSWGAWIKLAHKPMSWNTILSADNRDFDRALAIHERFVAYAGITKEQLASTGPLPSTDRWTFVASVYRQQTRTVALYVEDATLKNGNGGLVSDICGAIDFGPMDHTVRLGTYGKQGNPLNGALDNVFIVRGALTHQTLEDFRSRGATAIREYFQLSR